MKSYKRTLFISDLHLEENRPEMTTQFLRLLGHCDSSVDALYILGDLFETWIGDDDNVPFLQDVIKALKATTEKGLPIYFLHGNRDFLVGKHFLRKTGCKLLAEEAKVIIYNTPVLLMHGDTLCTRDVIYLKARKKGQNPILQKLFLLLPLNLRKHIANKMRAKSLKHTQATAMEIMDVTQEEVEHVMQKHQTYILIHGHTHKPAMHSFLLNHLPASRIVLGAWHNQAHILEWNELGKRTFKLSF